MMGGEYDPVVYVENRLYFGRLVESGETGGRAAWPLLTISHICRGASGDVESSE